MIPSWATLRPILVGGLVLAFVIVGMMAVNRIYQAGGDARTGEIERVNHAAGERADRASDPVDRCYAAGGRWLRDTGTCQSAVRGH